MIIDLCFVEMRTVEHTYLGFFWDFKLVQFLAIASKCSTLKAVDNVFCNQKSSCEKLRSMASSNRNSRENCLTLEWIWFAGCQSVKNF